jgi:hypothetical protein
MPEADAWATKSFNKHYKTYYKGNRLGKGPRRRRPSAALRARVIEATTASLSAALLQKTVSRL